MAQSVITTGRTLTLNEGEVEMNVKLISEDLSGLEVFACTFVFIFLIGCGFWCLCAACEINKGDNSIDKIEDNKKRKSESRSSAGSDISCSIDIEKCSPSITRRYFTAIYKSLTFIKK
uniref:Uncharacterized protein n=1 Tax=Caenorhabditis japonica TaxID=281687 RepID=A0A8R1EGJ2_CAEJA